jgi:hypothetical protein
MSDNNTKTWSEGLRFIQSKINLTLHSGKTSLCEVRFGTAQRIGLGDSPLIEGMYSSLETEEVLEQFFHAGMNNGRDKEDKEETNQQDRKDEDENQNNDTSEERVEKKDNKKDYYTIIIPTKCTLFYY